MEDPRQMGLAREAGGQCDLRDRLRGFQQRGARGFEPESAEVAPGGCAEMAPEGANQVDLVYAGEQGQLAQPDRIGEVAVQMIAHGIEPPRLSPERSVIRLSDQGRHQLERGGFDTQPRCVIVLREGVVATRRRPLHGAVRGETGTSLELRKYPVRNRAERDDAERGHTLGARTAPMRLARRVEVHAAGLEPALAPSAPLVEASPRHVAEIGMRMVVNRQVQIGPVARPAEQELAHLLGAEQRAEPLAGRIGNELAQGPILRTPSEAFRAQRCARGEADPDSTVTRN